MAQQVEVATASVERQAPAPTPVAGRTRRKMAFSGVTTASETRWLLWPPLIFFAVSLGAPMVTLVLRATQDGSTAFIEMFTMSSFTSALARTLIMAVVVTLAAVVFGAVYALGIWISPKWLAGVLVGWLFLSLWTSLMVRTVAWMLLEIPRGAIFWFLNLIGVTSEPINLYQTAFAMYPAMIAIMVPYVVLPVMLALNSLDREQLKAAVVFGAGPGLVFRSVLLPQIRPQIISGGVLVLVMSLGFYVTPLLLGGPANLTVSGVINLQINTANRPDLGASMSLLLVATAIVIYLIADRLFRVSEKWG